MLPLGEPWRAFVPDAGLRRGSSVVVQAPVGTRWAQSRAQSASPRRARGVTGGRRGRGRPRRRRDRRPRRRSSSCALRAASARGVGRVDGRPARRCRPRARATTVARESRQRASSDGPGTRTRHRARRARASRARRGRCRPTSAFASPSAVGRPRRDSTRAISPCSSADAARRVRAAEHVVRCPTAAAAREAK